MDNKRKNFKDVDIKKEENRNLRILVKTVIILLILIFTIYMGFIYWVAYEGIPVITQSNLTVLTQEEIQELVDSDILEISPYPYSLQFISVERESAMRETQYYIKFSINKEEYSETYLGKTEGGLNIRIVEQQEEKIILESKTNFTQNTKPHKYKFLNQLVDKYKVGERRKVKY